MIKITQQAKEELKRTLERTTLEPGKFLRLATPPVWSGEGDFGIVIDAQMENDHKVEFQGETVLLIDSDLIQRLNNATLDFEESHNGSSFTLDVY